MKTLSNQFCLDILDLEVKLSRALLNLVFALCSYQAAQSVVELSLSPIYRYEHTSIYKVIERLAKDSRMYTECQSAILQLCLRYLCLASNKRIRLQTDVTPLLKPHSPSLADRQYVKVSNSVIKGNKPISIGYPLSCIHWSAEYKWSLPLVRSRVSSEQTASSLAVEQLESLLEVLEEQLDLELIINTADSAYTQASYLCPLYEKENLVNITRFRYGTKVYTAATGDNPTGAKKVYDKEFHLRDATRTITGKAAKTGKAYEKEQISIFDLPHSEKQFLDTQTTKGKALHIELYRWNGLKMRSKNGHNMKHKAFDLLGVKVFDATSKKLVFKRTMFVCIFGKKRAKVTTREAYWDYRHRYDIEPSFRFNKQKLFLDSYGGESVQHIDNFLLVNQLANWLLYLAADEVQFVPRKWEKKSQKTTRLSIAKTRRSTESLFLTFDETPFLPQSTNKGKGRIKTKTKKYKVVKKANIAKKKRKKRADLAK